MSDGRNIESMYDRETVINELNLSSIPVYALGMNMLGGRNLSYLVGFSEHSGGTYLYNPENKFPSDSTLLLGLLRYIQNFFQ